MAAMSGKVVHNVFVSQCYQQDRQVISTQYRRDCCAPYVRNLLPCQGGKLAWTGISSMQLRALSKHRSGFVNRVTVHCNAASTTSLVPSLDKVDFLKLQNGSDIRGVAVAGVEGEPVSLTEPVAEAIAAAFAGWLVEKKKADASCRLRVSIGHDSRISAQVLQDAASRGIAGAGLDVVQYGLASTPAMFNSTLTQDDQFLCPVDGSIMITASHLPYNRNGFKLFTNAGGLGKADIKDILERAADIYDKFTAEGLMTSKEKASASVKRVDYMTVYSSDLVKAVRKAVGGIGLFPNHIPNPEDKTAMQAITQAVLANKADLGIIFDTDVDRNRLIALMSAIVLEEHPGTIVVTDSVTSDGDFTRFIEIETWLERSILPFTLLSLQINSVGEESHLAIETSGHGALKENHWLDDGAYLMVKILNKLASARAPGMGGGSKVITDLVQGLQEPAIAVELRLKINQNHPDLSGVSFREYGEAVLKHLENSIDSDPRLQKAPINYEGVRVSGLGGWFLLRLSLHDPVLPLNIEAASNDDAVKLGLSVLAAVEEFSALDTSALDKFVRV
ncbi:Phosphoglucomutase [Morella rubra]|uniref:Phosphoglucomutase n=1 Tax=Morella rubra TaxID=262757 RepID=A0A6A1W8F0_9ROSI|nr:Phosphoglucomutase [Morella rubra]